MSDSQTLPLSSIRSSGSITEPKKKHKKSSKSSGKSSQTQATEIEVYEKLEEINQRTSQDIVGGKALDSKGPKSHSPDHDHSSSTSSSTSRSSKQSNASIPQKKSSDLESNSKDIKSTSMTASPSTIVLGSTPLSQQPVSLNTLSTPLSDFKPVIVVTKEDKPAIPTTDQIKKPTTSTSPPNDEPKKSKSKSMIKRITSKKKKKKKKKNKNPSPNSTSMSVLSLSSSREQEYLSSSSTADSNKNISESSEEDVDFEEQLASLLKQSTSQLPAIDPEEELSRFKQLAGGAHKSVPSETQPTPVQDPEHPTSDSRVQSVLYEGLKSTDGQVIHNGVLAGFGGSRVTQLSSSSNSVPPNPNLSSVHHVAFQASHASISPQQQSHHRLPSIEESEPSDSPSSSGEGKKKKNKKNKRNSSKKDKHKDKHKKDTSNSPDTSPSQKSHQQVEPQGNNQNGQSESPFDLQSGVVMYRDSTAENSKISIANSSSNNSKVSLLQEGTTSGEEGGAPSSPRGVPTLSNANMGESVQLGQLFVSKVSRNRGGLFGIDGTKPLSKKHIERLEADKTRELKRQASRREKEALKQAEDIDKQIEHMKWTSEDGRIKYKGAAARIAIPDDKKDDYEMLKFSHNAWSGVRYYWVPHGEGRLKYITGEYLYSGFWKKGYKNGEGEGVFKAVGVEGIYKGAWKASSPHGKGLMLTRYFRYEGGWKEGKRHGFGEFVRDISSYTGDWSNDKKHGYGIAKYQDGTSYEGEWEEDERSGFGVCRYPDGSLYTGDWQDNQRHGQGTSIYASGNRYVGSWYKDMKQGKGTLFGSLDQKLYEGSWWRNKRHGTGTAWFLDSGDRYEGEWFLGKQHGEGNWFGADGSSYKGDYSDGFRHGIGLLIYPNGDRYVGGFVRGLREGTQNAYIYRDYGKYVGPFVKDRVSGYGEYSTFANRSFPGLFEEVEINDENGKYTGLVLNGKRHGRGVQIYNNGDRYDGEWREGVRAGFGVMLYDDGGKYVGFWIRDLRNKLGTYSLPNGEKYVGRWNKDKRHGIGTLIFSNSNRLVDIQWYEDRPADGHGVFVFANNSVYRGNLKNGLPDGRGILTVHLSILLRERLEVRKKLGLQFFLKGAKTATLENQFAEIGGGGNMFGGSKVSKNVFEDIQKKNRSSLQPLDTTTATFSSMDVSRMDRSQDILDAGQSDIDIAAFIDSAKANKSAMAIEFAEDTITFWRDFKNGHMLDGCGISIWEGNVYQGQYIGLERHGVGRMTRLTGETYFGEWKYDREWGIGSVTTRASDIYHGHFYNGFRNGVGSQTYPDGGTYYGKWMNDRRHGVGTFKWPDGTLQLREYHKGVLISERPPNDPGTQNYSAKTMNESGVSQLPSKISSLPDPYIKWAEDGIPPEISQFLNLPSQFD